MSQSNVAFIRSIYDARQRGDRSSVDWADPHIEYVMVDAPGDQISRGVPAMARAWREFLNAWEGFRLEAAELRGPRAAPLSGAAATGGGP